MPIWASKKWKLNVIETCQSPQLLSHFRRACPIRVHWHFSQLRTRGWDQRDQPPALLPPLPHVALPTWSPGSIGIDRGTRQCWAHREIRADGWRGWPGGRDKAGTYPASMQWEETFPATATALSPAALWEEVGAWPCVSWIFTRTFPPSWREKSYLGKRLESESIPSKAFLAFLTHTCTPSSHFWFLAFLLARA